jgi:hypothetical protein
VAQERYALPEVALPSSPSATTDSKGGNVKDDVLIAVDPHKAHNTLAVLDPATRMVIAEGTDDLDPSLGVAVPLGIDPNQHPARTGDGDGLGR